MPRGGAKGRDDEDTFQSADSGAAKTYPKQCSALRKNEVCMIKGHPCKIVDMSTSKTGKHGHAKVHLVGLDIFEGKKYEDICPSTHNMEVPFVNNKTYQLMDIDNEDFASLFDEKTAEEKMDLKLPDDDTGKNIRKEYDQGKELYLVVTEACGAEKITSFKVGTK